MKLIIRTLILVIIFLIGIFAGIGLQIKEMPVKILNKLSYMLSDNIKAINDTSTIYLKVRTFKPATNPKKFDTEKDATYQYEFKKIDLSESAIILMDVWESHPNDGLTNRIRKNINEKIIPLIETARRKDITLIHAPHQRKIANSIILSEEDIHLDKLLIYSTKAFSEFLNKKNINTLFYAGYSSNWCLMHRPEGIIAMNKLGYDTYLIRDCTIALESPNTLKGEWANKVIINTCEHQFGGSVLLKDIKTSLN